MTEQQPELYQQASNYISPEDQAKREEYRRRLAEYLKDPAFRAIEGFPIGTDEDILALSDPPIIPPAPIHSCRRYSHNGSRNARKFAKNSD